MKMFWKKRNKTKETVEFVEETVSYNDLKTEYDIVSQELSAKETDCAKRGLSYDDMANETRDLVSRKMSLSRKMRLIQDPQMQFGKKWKGKFFEFDKFVKLAKDGMITELDGNGLYASDRGVSDIEILPSDIYFNEYRKDFTRVLWFENKKSSE